MTTIHTHNQRAKRTLKRKSIKTFPTIPTPARTLFNSQADDLILGKEFSLGDVLSITTGRLLSERRMDGIYDILNWMTGDNLFTHQLPRAAKECKPWLIEQYPQLDPEQNPKLQTMLDKLTAMRKTESGKNDTTFLIRGWLSSIGRNFWGLSSDDKLIVFPLAASWDYAYLPKDPIQELAEMVGEDRVIAVQSPPSEEITQTTI